MYLLLLASPLSLVFLLLLLASLPLPTFLMLLSFRNVVFIPTFHSNSDIADINVPAVAGITAVDGVLVFDSFVIVAIVILALAAPAFA